VMNVELVFLFLLLRPMLLFCVISVTAMLGVGRLRSALHRSGRSAMRSGCRPTDGFFRFRLHEDLLATHSPRLPNTAASAYHGVWLEWIRPQVQNAQSGRCEKDEGWAEKYSLNCWLVPVLLCSSLTGVNYPGSDGGNAYSYLISVCDPLSSATAQAKLCLSESADTSVCQLDSSSSAGIVHDIGSWTERRPGNWSFIDPSSPPVGIQYSVEGSNQCWSSGEPTPYFSTLQFMCARVQGKEWKLITEPGSCNFTASISTPMACPEARSPLTQIRLTEL
jgi:hypothetical protein